MSFHDSGVPKSLKSVMEQWLNSPKSEFPGFFPDFVDMLWMQHACCYSNMLALSTGNWGIWKLSYVKHISENNIVINSPNAQNIWDFLLIVSQI